MNLQVPHCFLFSPTCHHAPFSWVTHAETGTKLPWWCKWFISCCEHWKTSIQNIFYTIDLLPTIKASEWCGSGRWKMWGSLHQNYYMLGANEHFHLWCAAICLNSNLNCYSTVRKKRSGPSPHCSDTKLNIHVCAISQRKYKHTITQHVHKATSSLTQPFAKLWEKEEVCGLPHTPHSKANLNSHPSCL